MLPTRVELVLPDSESEVLTTTPWEQKSSSQKLLGIAGTGFEPVRAEAQCILSASP